MNELTLDDLGLAAEIRSDLASEHARSLAATLDQSFAPDEPLPALWHWAFFNPVVPTSALGPDGHPARHGPTLAGFPRRMWVGGEVTATGELYVDTPAVRRTRLLDHTHKRGSTGDLLIVTLEHTVEQDATVVVTERQDVVYRGMGVTAPVGEPVDPPPPGGWREEVVPQAALLFRFSAVTFNTHRIHYDQRYATEVENYPDLVVHGPLTAMLLAGSSTRQVGRPIRSFAYRASSPLFVGQPIRIDGSADTADGDVTTTLTASRPDGVLAMSATAHHD